MKVVLKMDQHRTRIMSLSYFKGIVTKYWDKTRDWVSQTAKNDAGFLWAYYYSFLLILCIVGGLYQIITLMEIFFKYPVNVVVSIDPADSIELPGITLCSSVGVRRSSLLSFPGFQEDWQKVNSSGFRMDAPAMVSSALT